MDSAVRDAQASAFGAASLTQYSEAIRSVTFYTTSTRVVPRRISWSWGNDTVYCTTTRHNYRWMEARGASWTAARVECSRTSLFGVQGYLAAITSSAENDLLSTKLSSAGWISGDDTTHNQWKISTGPDAGSPFWSGPSAMLGGGPVGTAFSNWNANDGEPTTTTETGFRHPYMGYSGFWSAERADFNASLGYYCEYGGTATDPKVGFPLGGATIVGLGGLHSPDVCLALLGSHLHRGP